jgi:hypothetical protein
LDEARLRISLILVILGLSTMKSEGGQEMLEFRWKWAGHVSPQVIRAETMDEILAKVQESWHRDLGVPTASATVMNYIRKLVEEHNHLVPTGPAARAGLR